MIGSTIFVGHMRAADLDVGHPCQAPSSMAQKVLWKLDLAVPLPCLGSRSPRSAF